MCPSGAVATTSAMSEQTGQRSTRPAPRQRRWAPTARIAPHDPQLRGASVSSVAKSSSKRPASAVQPQCLFVHLILLWGRSEQISRVALRKKQ
jgi:hypothetical protein